MSIKTLANNIDSRFKENQEKVRVTIDNIKDLVQFEVKPNKQNYDILIEKMTEVVNNQCNYSIIKRKKLDKEKLNNRIELIFSLNNTFDECKKESILFLKDIIKDSFEFNIANNENIDLDDVYGNTLEILIGIKDKFNIQNEVKLFKNILNLSDLDLITQDLNDLELDNIEYFNYVNLTGSYEDPQSKDKLKLALIETMESFCESNSIEIVIFNIIKPNLISHFNMIAKRIYIQDFNDFLLTEKLNNKQIIDDINVNIKLLEKAREELIQEVKKSNLLSYSSYSNNSDLFFNLYKIENIPLEISFTKNYKNEIPAFLDEKLDPLTLEVKIFCIERNNYSVILKEQWESNKENNYYYTKKQIEQSVQKSVNQDNSYIISIFMNSINKLIIDIESTILRDLSISYHDVIPYVKGDIAKEKKELFFLLERQYLSYSLNQKISNIEKILSSVIQHYELSETMVDFIYSKMDFGDNGVLYFVENNNFDVLKDKIVNIIDLNIDIFNNEINESNFYRSFRDKLSETVTNHNVAESMAWNKIVFKTMGAIGSVYFNNYPTIGTILSSLSVAGDFVFDGVVGVSEKNQSKKEAVEKELKKFIKAISATYIKQKYQISLT